MLSAQRPETSSQMVSAQIGAVILLLAALLSVVLKPHQRLADGLPAINLAQQIPTVFGKWREDASIPQVLPDPTVQAQLDALYSQSMSRTYVNRDGQRIMLTIAYGSDQTSEATAAHRPEFCYRASGFTISDLGVSNVRLSGHDLTVRHLLGTMTNRIEPISYWVTLADKATLPGLGRKLSQIYFGLHGQIADGMLVRVSSIDADQQRAFALQSDFIADLESAMTPTFRSRYFGS